MLINKYDKSDRVADDKYSSDVHVYSETYWAYCLTSVLIYSHGAL